MLHRLALAFVALLATGAAAAQDPPGRWETVRTEHFRVHFPAAAEGWAEPAAARLEEWHRRVTDEVGYLPDRVIDVVVRDPYSTANGLALPFRAGPRIELWVTPPEAGSVIGDLRAWDELLLVHEDTHVAHMSRPSRNPVNRLLNAVGGFGPITNKAPPWVTEGYATLVEGRLTGSGRPNGAFRGALLDAYAREGRLPSYGELSYGTRYLTGSYRYLVGSAFLEWLEADVGPRVGASDHPLRDLWARMTAREIRSFDEAFAGVFRDAPQTLYARFCAEVTGAAMASEAAGKDSLFLDHPWGTSTPAVSPDGTRVAAVLADRRRAPALVVWDTAPDEDARTKWTDQQDKRLARDPEDVAAVAPAAWAPREVARRATREGIGDPAFLPDGALVYESWIPDGDGRYRPDLFRWDPTTHHVRRLTRGADLRTPASDGDGILAVHSTWGRTEIVRLDPSTGDTVVVVPPGPDGMVDQPTPGAPGLAWLEHHDSAWWPVVRMVDGDQRPAAPGVVDLAWGPDGVLYGVRGVGDRMELWRLWPDAAPVAPDSAPALGLAAGPDALWFTSLDATGVDLRRIALADLTAGDPGGPPAAPSAPPLPEPVPVTAAPYGIGHVDWRLLVGGSFSAYAGATELGLRLGDAAGRWELLLRGDPDPYDTWAGAGAALAIRSLPVTLSAYGWGVEGEGYAGLTPGGAAVIRLERAFRGGRAAIDAGGFGEGGEGGPRAAATLQAEAGWREPATERVYLGAIGRVSGGTGWLADVAAVAAIGRRYILDLSGGLGAAGGGEGFVLGGIDTGLVGPSARWDRLAEPGLPYALAAGAARLSADVALSTPFGSLFATRHLVGDLPGAAGATLAGYRVAGRVPRQPIAKLPAVDLEIGAGARIEDPTTGWAVRADPSLLTYWGRVGWRL